MSYGWLYFPWINLFCQCYQTCTCEVLISSFIVCFWYLHSCIDILYFHYFISNLGLLSFVVFLRFVNLDEVAPSNRSWFHFSIFTLWISVSFFFSFFLLVLVYFCSIILDSWGASWLLESDLIWDPAAFSLSFGIQYYKKVP